MRTVKRVFEINKKHLDGKVFWREIPFMQLTCLCCTIEIKTIPGVGLPEWLRDTLSKAHNKVIWLPENQPAKDTDALYELWKKHNPENQTP